MCIFVNKKPSTYIEGVYYPGDHFEYMIYPALFLSHIAVDVKHINQKTPQAIYTKGRTPLSVTKMYIYSVIYFSQLYIQKSDVQIFIRCMKQTNLVPQYSSIQYYKCASKKPPMC